MKQLFLTLLLMLTVNMAFAETPYSIEQAKEDMRAGRYAATIENLSGLIDKDQRNYEAWFLLGVAHVHEQRSHQAIEAFRQVIALRPELAEPHNNLAAVYNNLGDTKAAVVELEAALEKRPNYTVAEENLADLYVKLALQHYRNALAQSPNPIIEQRYARLIKVRNPMPTAEETQAEENASSAQTKESGATIVQEANPVKPNAPVSPVAVASVQISEPTVETTATVTSNKTPMKEPSITDVLDALEVWRLAWSQQNLDDYFAAYAENYKPDPRFDSLASWKEYKTRVIKNKKYIKVHFEQVEVNFNAEKSQATIMMLQRFRSNSYNGDDLKKIHMIHSAQGWKIIDEASIK